MIGWGDYSNPQANQLVHSANSTQPLQVNVDPNNLSGDVYIEHREFIQNIFSGTGATYSAFKIDAFDINAGLSNTFPWLSQLAQNFTLFKFEGLIFEFRPTTGESGGSTNILGKMIMATQYDPDADPFTSSLEMENYDYSQSAKPASCMIHGVETETKQSFSENLYVRTGASNKSKIFTDLGTFQIASEGIPTTSSQQLGELWVTYKIKLSRSRLYSSLANNNFSSYYYFRADGTRLLGSVLPTPTAAGVGTFLPVVNSTSNYLAGSENNLTCTLESGNLSQIVLRFPASVKFNSFLVTFAMTFPAAGVNGATIALGSTVSYLPKFIMPGFVAGNSPGRLQSNASATTTDAIIMAAVKVNQLNAEQQGVMTFNLFGATVAGYVGVITVQTINMEENE